MKLIAFISLISVGICLLGIDIGTRYIKVALEELGNGD
jgi:hypothetical protein